MKVYLIESNIDGYITYKIGKTSRNINNRLKELQTGNAGKLLLISEYDSPNANMIESALHRKYYKYKISGEWFTDDISPDDFIKSCKEIDNNLKKLQEYDNPFI